MTFSIAPDLGRESGIKKIPERPVYAITPFTMLDFPDRTACIVWFAGCPMRCLYCHNPQLIKSRGHLGIENALSFLTKRAGLLEGVVLSGGEASIYPGLPDFIRRARQMGYAIKLDTNGLRPDIIKSLLNENLLDYIALDYKAPAEKFKKISGTRKFDSFSETLRLLCSQKKISFEIRTTVHTDLLDENDIATILTDLDSLGYKGSYFIQNFRADNDRPTLGFLPPQTRPFSREKLPKPRNFSLGFRNF